MVPASYNNQTGKSYLVDSLIAIRDASHFLDGATRVSVQSYSVAPFLQILEDMESSTVLHANSLREIEEQGVWAIIDMVLYKEFSVRKQATLQDRVRFLRRILEQSLLYVQIEMAYKMFCHQIACFGLSVGDSFDHQNVAFVVQEHRSNTGHDSYMHARRIMQELVLQMESHYTFSVEVSP